MLRPVFTFNLSDLRAILLSQLGLNRSVIERHVNGVALSHFVLIRKFEFHVKGAALDMYGGSSPADCGKGRHYQKVRLEVFDGTYGLVQT